MAIITLKGVTKIYPDGFRAVEAVDLEIEHGEFVVLVGPSGCGKSTTLRMVAGLEEITDGTIAIDGKVVNAVAAKDRDLAMVFQSYALYPHLSARRNLAFGLERRRDHKNRLRRLFSPDYAGAARAEDAEIAAKVQAAADTLGITELLNKKPGELSGGQRQRVAVGRALVRDPKAFLFDEPLSNLDAKLRMEMRTELKALHRQTRATMVYVTHDQEEAMTLGDRLVVMKDGVVQQCATPAEVYARPANRFVAGFVGTPTMNFFEAELVEANGSRHLELCGSRLPVPPALDGRAPGPLVVGIRPDRLCPTAHDSPTTLPAEIRLIEDLGDRWDVVYRIDGETRAVGRIAPDPALAEGSAVHLELALNEAHLFEPGEDGDRIE